MLFVRYLAQRAGSILIGFLRKSLLLAKEGWRCHHARAGKQLSRLYTPLNVTAHFLYLKR